jgi:hypothetical protein
MNQSAPGDPELDPTAAADLLATADRLQRAVHDGGGSWVYVSWLVGMAVATAMYLSGLGVADTDRSVLVISVVFGVCVAGLSLGLLPRARASRVGFPRRWVASVVGWGVLYAASMLLGLLFFRAEPAFWLPAAALSALPLVLGARAEAAA